VKPPGEEVTVYEVIAAPFDAGSSQDTEILPVPATTETPDGASGALAGVISVVAIEGTDDTALLFAVELVIALNV
jgi:hypothetical protein